MAENEILFRQVNEGVEEIASRHRDGEHVYDFYCECANADCTMHVHLVLGEYERVRADPRRFVVLPGHALPEIERVVEEHDGWWVIEKVGEAGELAEAEDPRS
jgi:hypothetical protein